MKRLAHCMGTALFAILLVGSAPATFRTAVQIAKSRLSFFVNHRIRGRVGSRGKVGYCDGVCYLIDKLRFQNHHEQAEPVFS